MPNRVVLGFAVKPATSSRSRSSASTARSRSRRRTRSGSAGQDGIVQIRQAPHSDVVAGLTWAPSTFARVFAEKDGLPGQAAGNDAWKAGAINRNALQRRLPVRPACRRCWPPPGRARARSAATVVGDLALAQQLVEKFALGRDQLSRSFAPNAAFRIRRSSCAARADAGFVAQPEHGCDLVGQPALARDLFEPAQPRIHGVITRGELGLVLAPAFDGAVARHAEPTGDQRQQQSEPDQREDDDAEGDEQDQVAIRKRLPVGERERDRERGRQRDDAAYAGEADDERLLPRRVGITPAQRRAQPARQVGRRIDPDEARRDDDRGGSATAKARSRSRTSAPSR